MGAAGATPKSEKKVVRVASPPPKAIVGSYDKGKKIRIITGRESEELVNRACYPYPFSSGSSPVALALYHVALHDAARHGPNDNIRAGMTARDKPVPLQIQDKMFSEAPLLSYFIYLFEIVKQLKKR